MDGIAGLTQKAIEPGQTYRYEFTLRQSGTLMYHPHSDEMTQMALGMTGFFIIHPRIPETPRVDRDFAIFLNEWDIKPGTSTTNVFQMNDFYYFTFISKVWPARLLWSSGKGQRADYALATLAHGQPSHPHPRATFSPRHRHQRADVCRAVQQHSRRYHQRARSARTRGYRVYRRRTQATGRCIVP